MQVAVLQKINNYDSVWYMMGSQRLLGNLSQSYYFRTLLITVSFVTFLKGFTMLNKDIFITYIAYLAALPLVLEMVHVFVWEANGLQRQREFKRKKKILLEVKTLPAKSARYFYLLVPKQAEKLWKNLCSSFTEKLFTFFNFGSENMCNVSTCPICSCTVKYKYF